MNTLKKFQEIHNKKIIYKKDKNILEIFTQFDMQNFQKMNFFIKIFSDSGEKIYEEKISEIAFQTKVVRKILKKYFQKVYIEEKYSHENRVFFVYQK